ncbi:Putative alanine transaminase [Elusimicrobium minutum Pei191]|uniref:cysteine-S-conjugate beta-lyase n=1 Tax=Elusimicrobium minutum (strain Pei191) TaxID=445932 RepID=B2KD74_ELUMP|nr:MalY/PatB family protein [Elusimicrobium minutum]ACC98470.1 Putative alanine transaminase [Elusimicrobium minutum Pei191]
MGKYNFDLVYDRTNTGAEKYDFAGHGIKDDVIPMWVADMDFKTSDEIISALERTAKHGIFGYTDAGADYSVVLYKWYKERFNWEIMPGWITKVPGVVYAIFSGVRALTKENEAVIICQPVYHPFAQIVNALNRKLVVNELKLNGQKYEIDFEAFEKQIKENDVKLFILCSPHNPVGRVWTKEELAKLGDICLKHNVLVIADEIHADLVFKPYKHTVFASISDELAGITITCTAPTKTFNLAGLQAANAFTKNADLRAAFEKECAKTGYGLLNAMGLAAAKAAYSRGAEWLEELLEYLEGNKAYLKKTLEEMNCGINLIPCEGTYLMWLDCRALKMTDEELNNFFLTKAKIWLNKGVTFGRGGSGFMRMNIACPRATLERALNNLKNAFAK